MKKTIVVYSGGLDSTVLLAEMVRQGREVRALSVNYGQRHRKEILAANEICDRLSVEHQIVNLSGLREIMQGSSQTDSSVPVPHGHYAEESMKLTVVPNRNMLLLATAATWAISLKYDTIAYGAHAGDHAIYPDCRPAFVNAFQETLALADWHKVVLEGPFTEMTKDQIVRMGVKAGHTELMGLSWSCYEGGDLHCGKCGTCVERKEAFELNKFLDPTKYEA